MEFGNGWSNIERCLTCVFSMLLIPIRSRLKTTYQSCSSRQTSTHPYVQSPPLKRQEGWLIFLPYMRLLRSIDISE